MASTRPLVRSGRSASTSGWPSHSASTGRACCAGGARPRDLAVPDKWIPATEVARSLDISATVSGRADFAVRLAEQRRVLTSAPTVVLREEPDLRSALRLLSRYELRACNEALRMRLEETDEIATIRLWFEFGEPARRPGPRPRCRRAARHRP